MKLETDYGHWALHDNSMIFDNIVWISDEKEALKYHLVDDNGDEIPLEKDISEYIKTE